MTAPKTIAQTICTNLKADVTVAGGAPVALGHAYSGRRKNYDWRTGPITVLHLARRGIDEKQYTLGAGGRRRITYHASIDLVWANPDVDDAASDNVKPSDDFLTLIESVKASLRKHNSLGGQVTKCAYEEIRVDEPLYDAANIPHWETSLHFDVLDEIAVTPQP